MCRISVEVPSRWDKFTVLCILIDFFFSSRRRHTRSLCDWSSDVCSSDLYMFLRAFLVLYRLIRRPDQDEETAQKTAHDLALTLCLRAFRGVPELEKPGVCYSKDVVYLRGLLLIQRAVEEDVTILDRLAVGRIALEHLPAIEQLGIVPPLQPLRKLAQDSIFSGMEY